MDKQASNQYWVKRAEQEVLRNEKEAQQALKQLRYEYESTLREMEKEIAHFYSVHGADNVLQFADLQKRLTPSELQSLYRDFDSFAKANPQYAHLAGVRDEYYKLSRYEYLEQKMAFNTLDLASRTDGIVRDGLKGMAEKSYMNSLNAFGLKGNIKDSVIDNMLNKKWIENANFSNRLWGKPGNVNKVLNRELQNGIIRGDGAQQMSKKLADIMGSSYKDAERLVLTESAYVHSAARLESFKDAGVKEYRFVATLDGRTSEICSSLDGKKFSIDKGEFGLTLPPLHPRCRSTIVPVTDIDPKERVFRDLDGKSKIGEYKDYKGFKADRLLKEAVQKEPSITRDIKRIVKKNKGRLEGLEYKLKAKEGITNKVILGEKVKDSLRYTSITSKEKLVDHYFKTIEDLEKKGYNVIEVKNTWESRTNPYRGVNVNMIKDEFIFEIQFHTPQSFQLKQNELHDIYEEWRALDYKSEKALVLKGKMFKISEALIKPKNIERIK